MSDSRSGPRGNKRSSDSSRPSHYVERPDKRDFDNKIQKFDAELDEIKKRQELIKAEQQAMRSSRSGIEGEFSAARKAFQEAKKARDAQSTIVKSLFDRVKVLSANIKAQAEKEREARSARRFRSVEDIERRVEDLERRQETESLSLREDKDIVAQIKELNALKREMSNASNVGKSKEAMILSRKALSEKIDAEKKKRDELDATLDVARAEMDRLHALRPARSDADKLHDEFMKLRARADEVWAEKKKARAEHKKQLDAFYEKLKAARAKREEEEKARKLQEARDRARAQREEDERLATEKPWQVEIAECDRLLLFLRSKLPKTAKAVEAKSIDLAVNGVQPLARKGTKGVMLGGGKGKKKGKTGKKKAQKLHLPLEALGLMGKFRIAIPTSVEDVPAAIDAVQAKRNEYDTKPRPAVPVRYFFEDRVNTTMGTGTVQEQRKDGAVIVTLDWHLANDTKVTAFLNKASILSRL